MIKLIDNFYRAFVSIGIATSLACIYINLAQTGDVITLYNFEIPLMILCFFAIFTSYLISKNNYSYSSIIIRVFSYVVVFYALSLEARPYQFLVIFLLSSFLAICEILFKYSGAIKNLDKKINGISMHSSYGVHFVYFLFSWIGASSSLIAYFRNQDTTLMFCYAFILTVLLSGSFLLNLKKEKLQE